MTEPTTPLAVVLLHAAAAALPVVGVGTVAWRVVLGAVEGAAAGTSGRDA